MNNVTVLVGLPCSGKSSYVNENHKESFIISMDTALVSIGAAYGVTDYNECFARFLPAIEDGKLMDALMELSLKYKNVVIDRTNLTLFGRKKYIDFYTQHGYHICCRVFNPTEEQHKLLVAGRSNKVISNEAMEAMRLKREWPTLDEGFENIRHHKYH